MKIANISFAAAAVTSLMLLSSPALAKQIVGTASVANFGPVSKELVERAKPVASASFKEEFHIWLKEDMRIDVDTANTLKKFAFDKLAERCLESADRRSVTRGRVWTLTLSVSDDAARSAVDAHNARYEAIAVSQWDRYKLTLENDTAAAFSAAITSLAAAAARVTNTMGGSRVGPYQYDDIRARVQNLFDKMVVKSDLAVIEGRPGSRPVSPPTASVSLGGKPLAGFSFTAFVQNGRQIARMATNENGSLPLSSHIIPFVHNSSMLTVSPDARGYIKADNFIRYKDMGIRFTKGQELTFIYKVPTLTYALEYKVSSEDKAIVPPHDFTDAAHIRKYLKDSCSLQPAQNAASADIGVKINVVFSKAIYENTEEDALIMTATAEFRGAGGSIDLSDKTVFEKRYAFGINMQMGEYFWEATRALRGLIRGTLNQEGQAKD
jgi:hypothetical protein